MITPKKKIASAFRPTQTKPQPSIEREYDEDIDTNEDETDTPSPKREAQASRPVGKPQPTRTPSGRSGSGGGSKGSSLADRLNSIAKSFSNNASDVPPGMYEAVVSEAVMQAPDPKGQSVRLKFELCDEEFKDKNQLTQWFRIFDADGEGFQGGIRSLMYNFARLGVELRFEGDTQEEIAENLNEQLREIAAEKPGIIAKVANNPGSDGRIFTNVNIEKPCDNDVVQAYKDSVPY